MIVKRIVRSTAAMLTITCAEMYGCAFEMTDETTYDIWVLQTCISISHDGNRKNIIHERVAEAHDASGLRIVTPHP